MKDEFINELTIRLACETGADARTIKEIVSTVAYDYSVCRVETTEMTATDGTVTMYLWNYFQMGKLSQNISLNSIKQYKLAVFDLCRFAGKELSNIASEDIQLWLILQRQKGNRASTLNNKRLYLSTVFNYLHNHGKIVHNPMNYVDAIKYHIRLKEPLSEYEIEKIYLACEMLEPRLKSRNVAMISFMLDTGVRVSELCEIKFTDIDFQKKRCIVLGKGNKERSVFFGDKTVVRIADYLQYRQFGPGDHLFTNVRQGKLSKESVEVALRKVGEMSGVSRLHPHLLRATFATNLSAKGRDINTIAKLLGHANLNTINRYVILSEEQLAK